MLQEIKIEAQKCIEKIVEIRKLLDIESKERQLKELQDKASDKNLWNDQSKAQSILQNMKNIEGLLNQ